MSSENITDVKRSRPLMCAVNEAFDATNRNPLVSIFVVPGLLSVLWGAASGPFGNAGAEIAVKQGLWSELPVVGPITFNAYDQSQTGEKISYASGCKDRFQ